MSKLKKESGMRRGRRIARQLLLSKEFLVVVCENCCRAMITEPFYQINGKGQDGYQARNFLRIQVTSNDLDCVPTGD